MPLSDFKNLSPRQIQFMRESIQSERSLQLAYGSVRSGKNFAGAIALMCFLRFEPVGYETSDFIFCGASIKAVYRILLKNLFELVGEDNYTYNRADGSGRIYDRAFYSFGFTNANSHEPIRGMDVGGLAGTEATFCHPDFFDESNLRLSYPGSKAFWDTNPGPPTHYLKQMLDDPEKAGEIQAHHFLLNDNPFIMKNPAYIRKLYAMYPPGTLLHKRMIQGEWAMAEGRIFDTYTDRHLIPRYAMPLVYDRKVVGIDYGTQNACVFLLIGIIGRTYYVIREYYYSGRETGVQQTTGQYLQDLLAFVRGEDVDGYYADPSAAYFIAEMDQAGLPVEKANNAVLPGIQAINTVLAENRMFLCKEDTPRLQKEMVSYVWDLKAQERGVEQPIKKADHGPDAARYAIATIEDGMETTSSVWDDLEREFLLNAA